MYDNSETAFQDIRININRKIIYHEKKFIIN